MIRATPPLGRGLANPQKCGILKSQGGRRWQQRALRTEHEDLWRGDFRTSQRARAHAEGVGRADQEKGWDSDRAGLYQRYRARSPWPASAGFRGATGGRIGSSTRRPAVLCRTAPRGRAEGTARSFTRTPSESKPDLEYQAMQSAEAFFQSLSVPLDDNRSACGLNNAKSFGRPESHRARHWLF